MTYNDYGIDIPSNKISGEVKTLCPECSHLRKKKTDPCLSVNLDKKLWQCFNCGWTGSLLKKQYTSPVWQNKTQLSESIVDFFLSRNITQDTLSKMLISESVEFMPQVGEKRKVMCFNYFRDGKLVNVKCRDREKNFKLHKDAELIFYNLDGIKGVDTCYIVEGEMDALTMIELGYTNTVSVPNGANKKTNNLAYLDNCYQYFEKMDKVYIMTDDDESGNKLGEELARRIGIEKCIRVKFGGFKDINEAYANRCDIRDLLDKGTPYPIAGITTIADIWDEVENFAKNGYPPGWKPNGTLGRFLQFYPGYLTLINGVPGHGKSEWVDFILMQLSIIYNLKGAYFSPENMPFSIHAIKLAEKILGKRFEKAKPAELLRVKEHLESTVYFLNADEGYTIDSILERVRQCVLRHGINWYVLDPWNRIEHQYANNETKYISEVLDKIRNFNQKNNCHCFLIAHPTKMQKDQDTGAYEVPGPYNFAGSANFYNKGDICLTVYKELRSEINQSDYTVSIYVQKMKFRHWGSTGQIVLQWNPENGRYDDYGCDLTDWILAKPKAEQTKLDLTLQTESGNHRSQLLSSVSPTLHEPVEVDDDPPF